MIFVSLDVKAVKLNISSNQSKWFQDKAAKAIKHAQ